MANREQEVDLGMCQVSPEWKHPLRQMSPEWMQIIYPLDSVIEGKRKLWDKLAFEGRGNEFDDILMRSEKNQVFFAITEFGTGVPLPIQPSYWGEIEWSGDGLRVYVPNLRDIGDQKKSYLDFDGIDESVRKGLGSVYETLQTMQINEGMFRVSPSEFYKDFKSTHDVVEFYRVVKVSEDGKREFEARYLILDRVLSREERLFLVNGCQGSSNEIPVMGGNGRAPYSIDNLALNPQRALFERNVNDPMILMMWEMANRFSDKFRRNLVGVTDFAMYAKIMDRVEMVMPEYINNLIAEDKKAIWTGLLSLLYLSQRDWALDRGLDPVRHIRDIEDGLVVIGFEMGFEGLDPAFDSFFNRLNEIGGKRYCEIHLKHHSGQCPDCSASRRNWS